MASQLVRELPAERAYANTRARVISLLGPVTVAAGVVWAIVQPYRLTFLHPHGQGFWWLAIEPPLLVMFAGVVFAVFVARPLVADLEDDAAA
jgi:formate hydrogenlyase subunit 3/multisubunit Na+/H+ antiporter MnhD subunit